MGVKEVLELGQNYNPQEECRMLGWQWNHLWGGTPGVDYLVIGIGHVHSCCSFTCQVGSTYWQSLALMSSIKKALTNEEGLCTADRIPAGVTPQWVLLKGMLLQAPAAADHGLAPWEAHVSLGIHGQSSWAQMALPLLQEVVLGLYSTGLVLHLFLNWPTRSLLNSSRS